MRINLITLGLVFFVGVASVSGDEFRIRLGVQNRALTYVNWYNYFGISPLASDGHDIYDMINMFSPEPHYIDLYFPHDDPSRPDYWSPPYTGKYAADIRNDEFDTKIFYFDIFSTATTTETVAIFWVEEDSVPPTYKIEIKPIHENGVNIFSSDTLWQIIPPGVHYYSAVVKKNAYDHIELLPSEMFIRKNERIWVRTLLVGAEDTVEVHPRYEVLGESARYEDGFVLAHGEGVSRLVADFRGLTDTALIVVSGTAFPVNLRLEAGWNFMSIPVQPSVVRAECLLGPVWRSVLEYDAATGSFGVPDEIIPGRGYFVFVDNDTTIRIAGAPIEGVEVHLSRGWNAIGAPLAEIDWGVISGRYPGVFFACPFGFGDGIYYLSENILPTRGYWVYSLVETTITISP
ncbi:hypothetical protein J7K99_08010 [bacterium]|nr:hypothetical protein [bacterium]